MIDREPEWVHLGTDANGLKMNAYFVEHPEMILGQMKEVTGPYGLETACVPVEGESLNAQLASAIENIHGEIQSVDLDELSDVGNDDLPADPSQQNRLLD